ncbi:MAG TPA: LuxR C-terminal-related transcriptional regulator [Jatrophihabitans sp.]|nr:LuxR C-terminal-related transcriptional regulator [Jatrophihabitans sp.]
MVLMSSGESGAPVDLARNDGGAQRSTDGPDEVIIATKLFVPTRRRTPITRPRVNAQLRRALGSTLTLVVAPAGWGKTTAIAEWLATDDVHAGWVSLDEADNDTNRFWRYLLEAIAHAGDGLAEAALRRLHASGADIARDVLPVLLNDLSQATDDVVVVLDDYHSISNPAVHSSVGILLEHAPRQFHLVLGTRIDPPLPVSRLRVDGALAELRADLLRFTIDEAAELLSRDAAGVDISTQDVGRLVTRTEGWAAGLHLAALRLADLSGNAAPAEFIERFTGADRHVIDYLGEEVLATQPEHTRDFLLRTSVLNRISAPLASALTGQDDAARTLDDVYRANLFLAPLDDELRWFRYHHLFRDILRHELSRVDPAAPGDLHRRAARWYAEQGEHVEAVWHAFAANDDVLAGELVAAVWRREFNAGHLQTVQGWLDALPAELVAGDVRLATAQVWLELDAGRLGEAGAALEAAARQVGRDPHLQVLRALHTYKVGDLRSAADQLRELPPTLADPFLLTVRDLLTGVTAMWLDDAGRAATALTDAAATADRTGNRLAHTYALGCRALLAAGASDIATAEHLLRDVDAELRDEGSDAHFVAMFPALARARCAAALGEYESGAGAARHAVELAHRGAGRVEIGAALITAVAIARASGAADAAALLEEARAVIRTCPDPGPVVSGWLAAEQRARATVRGPAEPLTERERAVLSLLPGPLSQREIAKALYVTPNTLKTHLRAVYRKLDAESRTEAVTRARERGLL